jgi:hypothetical protein
MGPTVGAGQSASPQQHAVQRRAYRPVARVGVERVELVRIAAPVVELGAPPSY